MDQANPFETRTTFRLHRAEYLVGLAVCAGLMIAHVGEIRWPVALALFAYIDLIGYLPGAIAYRRSGDGRISRVYYVLYNTMHSLITQAAVAALWCWLVRPEWALLALPLHLCGDRGLFGNFLKPFALRFEPEAEPGYRRLADGLRGRAAGRRVPVPVTAPAPVPAAGRAGSGPKG
ncbi:membrane protein [Streptomyces fumigatiscleroticus]|nr:membrane protein [Streptomyces fumigatiscleroticus]